MAIANGTFAKMEIKPADHVAASEFFFEKENEFLAAHPFDDRKACQKEKLYAVLFDFIGTIFCCGEEVFNFFRKSENGRGVFSFLGGLEKCPVTEMYAVKVAECDRAWGGIDGLVE